MIQTKSSKQITPRQLQILNLLARFQISQPYSATIQELAQELGISRTTAFEHIAGLREKNLLSAETGKARSLKLTKKGRSLLNKNPDRGHKADLTCQSRIPLLGRIAAGAPIEAVQDSQNLSLADQFGTTDDVFALQIHGDSMAGDNIHDGDYIICRRTSNAENGQIVVANLDDGDVTLKRFYKQPNSVRLQPSNDNYEPIYSDNCRIEAVALGILRKF